MLKVIISKEDNNIKRVEFQGHAMFDDFGKDIVCAAASSIMTTTVNACLKLDKDSIIYNYVDNGLILDIISNDMTTTKLVENMIELLEELENEYPKNIKVK